MSDPRSTGWQPALPGNNTRHGGRGSQGTPPLFKVGKGSGKTRRYGFPQQERSDERSGVWGLVPKRGAGRQPCPSLPPFRGQNPHVTPSDSRLKFITSPLISKRL